MHRVSSHSHPSSPDTEQASHTKESSSTKPSDSKSSSHSPSTEGRQYTDSVIKKAPTPTSSSEPEGSKAAAKRAGQAALDQAVNDPNSKYLTEDERKLIKKHGLTYDHHNDGQVFLKAPAAQDGPMDAEDAQHWYRAMNKDDLKYLGKNGELPPMKGYGGIATNRNYAKKYLTNDSNDAVAEMHVPNEGRLHDLFQANGINYKSEGDGGTYGLGNVGTQDHRPGARDRQSSLGIFNQYVDPRPRVVNLKIPNRGMLE